MRRVCIVIPAAAQARAAQVLDVLDPDMGGALTFSVALSATGAEPATHYGCAGVVDVQAMREQAAAAFRTWIDAQADEKGRKRPGSLSGFKTAVKISRDEQDFDDFIFSLGLRRVVSP